MGQMVLRYLLRTVVGIHADLKLLANKKGLNGVLNFISGGIRERVTIRFDTAINDFNVRNLALDLPIAEPIQAGERTASISTPRCLSGSRSGCR